MKKVLILMLLIMFLSPVLAAKDTKEVNTPVDRGLNEDGKGKGKGKGGKPDSPGAHGRLNAETKKAANPGKGGGKNKSQGGAQTDDLIDGNKEGKNKRKAEKGDKAEKKAGKKK